MPALTLNEIDVETAVRTDAIADWRLVVADEKVGQFASGRRRSDAEARESGVQRVGRWP